MFPFGRRTTPNSDVRNQQPILMIVTFHTIKHASFFFFHTYCDVNKTYFYYLLRK